MIARCAAQLGAGVAAITVALTCWAGADTPAIGADYPAPQREAYERSLADPFNLDLMFEAAQSFESANLDRDALWLYRRMLTVNETLDPIRFRVAFLEYQLGNNAAALAEIVRLEASNLTPDLSERLARLRDGVEKELTPHRLEGNVASGFRFQSNANYAPTGTPRILGAAFTQFPSSSPQSDGSVFLEGDVGYRLDPGRQDGLLYEADAALEIQRQFSEEEFNYLSAEFVVGPRFQLLPDAPGRRSVKAGITGAFLMFDDDVYSYTPGLALEYREAFSPELSLSTTAHAAWRLHGSAAQVSFFSPTPNAVTAQTVDLPIRDAEDRDGLDLTAAARASWLASPRLNFAGQGFVQFADAKDDAVTRFTVGLAGGVSREFDVELGPVSTAAVSATGAYAYSVYRDIETQILRNPGLVDPAVPFTNEPLVRRQDHYIQLALRVDLPIDSSLVLFADGRWDRTFSNIVNFDTQNFTTSLGVGWSF